MKTKIYSISFLLIVSIVIIGAFSTAIPQDSKMPPAREVPGLNSPDKYPKACVSCHINYPEMKTDARLSVLSVAWNTQVEPGLLAKSQAACNEGVTLKGKHPSKFNENTNIPQACITCHSKTSKNAPEMGKLMHTIHLTGKDNTYFSWGNGDCTNCHKMDKSGDWSIPSGKESEVGK
ncbi:MAG: hypothetical protein HW421_653 [Ignavibacteria bacterium]|nr:hypothetical protein [Ignavibacteria bacterium]